MNGLFLKILNMSISASWLVLAVVLLRLLFRKAPKWISCILWGIVALRLILPFQWESVLSLIPSAEVIPQNIATTQTPAIYSGIPAVNSAVNPLFTQHLAPESNGLEAVLYYVSVAWLAGAAVLLLCSVVSYLRLRRKVWVSLRLRENLYVCDEIDTPFILGIAFPRIYIPSGLDAGSLRHVLAHEKAHLKRLDHLWKPLGFLLLTVHWFNPLLWLAYILLCRDIEQACDEKVIAQMDNDGKRSYSEALVACSVHRRLIMACPVAFGEVGVKTRIKSIIHYKKPSFWIVIAAVAACAVTAVCFLTNPEPCDHEYSSEITVSATCTQEGVETFTCRLCDHSYTAPAPLLAHTYKQGDVRVAPDCVHEGVRELVCTGCGAVVTETMEITAHTFGASFYTIVPNCAQRGELSAECTSCHSLHVVGSTGTNQDHNLHEFVTQEATCENPGEGYVLCSRCDYEERCTYEPYGHNYVEVCVIEGNCRRSDILKMECTTCSELYFLELPKYGDHVWKSIGSGRLVCECCGIIKNESGSSSGLWGSVVPPFIPGRVLPWFTQQIN